MALEFTENPEALKEILNGQPVRELMNTLAHDAITTARSIYANSTRGEDTPPFVYNNSFTVREESHDGVQSVDVYNEDPTAEWVEFGALAGGTTRILGYRVLGKTLDVLGSAFP